MRPSMFGPRRQRSPLDGTGLKSMEVALFSITELSVMQMELAKSGQK